MHPGLEDNQQGGMALGENPLSPVRKKLIDVRFHFFGELLSSQKIDIQFEFREEHIGDVLTKSLAALLNITVGCC